jgi:hypothetical protein
VQLSSLLADIGLNIREAHVFSTDDGYSLDVFVVDGWPTEVCLLLEWVFLFFTFSCAIFRVIQIIWPFFGKR